MFEPFPSCTVDVECIEYEVTARLVVLLLVVYSVAITFVALSHENRDGNVTTQTVSSQ